VIDGFNGQNGLRRLLCTAPTVKPPVNPEQIREISNKWRDALSAPGDREV